MVRVGGGRGRNESTGVNDRHAGAEYDDCAFDAARSGARGRGDRNGASGVNVLDDIGSDVSASPSSRPCRWVFVIVDGNEMREQARRNHLCSRVHA